MSVIKGNHGGLGGSGAPGGALGSSILTISSGHCGLMMLVIHTCIALHHHKEISQHLRFLAG